MSHPSDRTPPPGGRLRDDGWPRDPSPSDMMHAYFESKAGGYTGAADWGDLCYEVTLRTG